MCPLLLLHATPMISNLTEGYSRGEENGIHYSDFGCGDFSNCNYEVNVTRRNIRSSIVQRHRWRRSTDANEQLTTDTYYAA